MDKLDGYLDWNGMEWVSWVDWNGMDKLDGYLDWTGMDK